jgi:hypothetical protein
MSGTSQQPPGVSNISEGASLALVNHQLGTMRQDMRDMKEAVQAMAEGITKMGLIERDLEHFKSGQERAFVAISKVEDHQEVADRRIAALEQLGPAIQAVPTLDTRVRSLENVSMNSTRTSSWVDKGVLGAFVLLAMYVGSKLGIV